MRTREQHMASLSIGYPVLRGGRERYITLLHRAEEYVRLDGDPECVPFSELQFSERIFESDKDGNVRELT